jgi:hypothetical protein
VYFSVPPETLTGFIDILTQPSLVALCDAIIGPGWQVVEVGCDLPGPHARDQPWHRDYSGTWDSTTLAVNIAGLLVRQVTAAMGGAWSDIVTRGSAAWSARPMADGNSSRASGPLRPFSATL